MNINEKFNTRQDLLRHYKKHSEDFKSDLVNCYEQIADSTARKEVDDNNVFGFVSGYNDKLVSYAKYDKETNVFVAYYYRDGGSEPIIMTCYKMSFDKFNRRMNRDKIDDIPQGL